MPDVTIKSLTPQTFDDFAALVERNKGMLRQLLVHVVSIPMTASRAAPAEDNRAFKKRRVDEGIAHAALVYDGDLVIASGRSTAHRRSYPASITARSTSPPRRDCPTTGSPASRSTRSTAARAWRRSPCVEPWT